MAAIGREAATGDFTRIVFKPVNFFGGDVEESGVLVTVGGVRCDQDVLAVGRNIVGLVESLAFMRGQQRALGTGDVDHKYVVIGALRLLLCVDDELPVFRPDW